VILLSRFGALAMVALSLTALARIDGYANKPLARAITPPGSGR